MTRLAEHTRRPGPRGAASSARGESTPDVFRSVAKEDDAFASPERPDEEFDTAGADGFMGATASSALNLAASKQGLHAKLEIGSSDDPLEKEADRVAEAVTSESPVEGSSVAAEEQEPIRMKGEGSASGGTTASNAQAASIGAALATGGSPLPPATRKSFESKMGADFSGVRVHTGEKAAESAKSIGARAYALGKDVVFGKNEFAPGSSDGKTLLAHELSHVVQETKVLRRKEDGNVTEKEAPVSEEAELWEIEGRRTEDLIEDYLQKPSSGIRVEIEKRLRRKVIEYGVSNKSEREDHVSRLWDYFRSKCRKNGDLLRVVDSVFQPVVQAISDEILALKMMPIVATWESPETKKYLDPKKIPTIGIGFNVRVRGHFSMLQTALGLSDAEMKEIKEGKRKLKNGEIRQLYIHTIMNETIGVAKKLLGEEYWPGMPEIAKMTMIEIVYGYGAFKRIKSIFQRFIVFLQKRKWKEAGVELTKTTPKGTKYRSYAKYLKDMGGGGSGQIDVSRKLESTESEDSILRPGILTFEKKELEKNNAKQVEQVWKTIDIYYQEGLLDQDEKRGIEEINRKMLEDTANAEKTEAEKAEKPLRQYGMLIVRCPITEDRWGRIMGRLAKWSEMGILSEDNREEMFDYNVKRLKIWQQYRNINYRPEKV